MGRVDDDEQLRGWVAAWSAVYDEPHDKQLSGLWGAEQLTRRSMQTLIAWKFAAMALRATGRRRTLGCSTTYADCGPTRQRTGAALMSAAPARRLPAVGNLRGRDKWLRRLTRDDDTGTVHRRAPSRLRAQVDG